MAFAMRDNMKGVVEEFLMFTLYTLESDDNVFTLCWTFKPLETLSNIPGMEMGMGSVLIRTLQIWTENLLAIKSI